MRTIIKFGITDGVLTGYDVDNGSNHPVAGTADQLAAVVENLNAAALARVEQINADKQELEQQHAAVLAEKDAALADKDTEHAAVIAAKDAELAAAKKAFDELSAFKTAMEQRVSSVLQSGDPAQYEALAREFLTPAQEKARQEKLAQIAKLQAELAALESDIATP